MLCSGNEPMPGADEEGVAEDKPRCTLAHRLLGRWGNCQNGL